MKIEIDYNPPGSDIFWISVYLNEKEVIAFTNTGTGARIVKQVLVEKKPIPTTTEINGEWDVLVFIDGMFTERYHVRWVNLPGKAWCNDEIWETVWSQPLLKEDKEILLRYSQLFSDKYEEREHYSKTFPEFETFLTKQITELMVDSKKE